MTDRAAVPGKQVVRVDNVKAKSWVNTNHGNPPLIGQIFFATDSSTLDNADMVELEKIDREYRSKLNLYQQQGKSAYFTYYGYADYRHTMAHNYDLSQKRADAVASYLGQPERLGGYKSYVVESKGLGVDYKSLGRPPASKELEDFRRVDILAPPPMDPQPKPEVPGELKSTTWKARLKNSIGVGPPGPVPWQFDIFWLEIVDLTNNIAMMFKYKGMGFGKSFKGLPGYSASSGWYQFKTSLRINIMDFEGGASHLSGQLQAGIGGSHDSVRLAGPTAHKGEPPVKLVWEGFTRWDKAAGVGAGITFGGISPDPPGQKPYPAPG